MSSTTASSIKKLAINGAIWTLIGYGASQILRFGSNLVLTRLLSPELFGLMSLVYVFIAGLHLFSDLGINTSVVQNKRGDDPDFLNTAWTIQVIRGVGLWICCLIIAFPAAHIYKDAPQLLWLIPIVGLNTVIAGFNSTALFTLNRHLSVKQLSLFELSGQIVSITVMLVWAWFNRTIWALVVGGLVSAVFQLVMSYRLSKGTMNRFTWDRSAVQELVSFGKWIFFTTALTFLANQADRLFIGKYSITLLGVYGVAFTLADVPRQLMLAVSAKVIFPAYSRLIDMPRAEFRSTILRNRRPILMAMALVLACLACGGDLIVGFLYDNRYEAATWMLPLLALGAWPVMLTQTIDPVLFALGQPQYIAFGCFLSFLCFAIGIPLGFSVAGSVGAIVAIAVSNIPPWIVVTYALRQHQLMMLRQDVFMTTFLLILLSLLLMVRQIIGLGLPLDNLFATAI